MSMSIGHTPFCIKRAKNGTFGQKKKNGARPTNPYIFRISVTRGMSLAYLYGHTLSVSPKNAKNGIFARKNNGATLKTLACRHNLTLRITWGGSYLAVLLFLCV